MRFLVLAFGALACIKVWTQDHIVRSAMGDALLQAYRERAQQVCGRETAKSNTAAAAPWPTGSAAEVMIGSPVPDVKLWDYDNPMWDVRYRHAHLVLTTPGPRKLRCSFDLSLGIAFVQTL